MPTRPRHSPPTVIFHAKTSLLNGPVRLQPPEGGVQADLTVRGAQHAKREVFRLQRRRRKASVLWRCR